MPTIYTKTGDRGETGLGNGKRVSKDDARIEAIGAVDEVNAWIGVLQTQNSAPKAHPPRAEKLKTDITHSLRDIQSDLFYIGAFLSKAKAHDRAQFVKIFTDRTRILEEEIDALTKELPPLTNFILPGGSETGAAIHVARAVVRRAERSVVALMKTDDSLAPVLVYLNRLSDFLFTLARWINQQEGVEEERWVF